MATQTISPTQEPIKVVASIIQTELGLSDGQVMLSYQNYPIPETVGLYVSLAYGTETVIGSTNYNSTDLQGNYLEVQAVSMMHGVDIEVMSFDDSARLQKEQVVMALSSVNAQNVLAKNNMRLASTPTSFITIGDEQPAKQLNRYHFTVQIYALHEQTLSSSYFDSLQKVDLVVDP